MRHQRRRGRRNERQSHPQLNAAVPVSLLSALLFLQACAPKASPESINDSIQRLLVSGDSVQALKLAEQGIETSSRNHDERWYWTFYLSKVEAVLQKDGAKAALTMLDAARIPVALRELEARRELDQAKAQFWLSDYEEAEKLLTNAAKLAESAGATGLRVNILIWLANVYARLQHWGAAQTSAQEGYRLASATGEDWRRGQGLGTLGFLQMEQSRFEDALHYFDQQLPLIRPEERSSRARALNNAAVCHYRLGELDTALSYFQQALAINIEIRDTGEQSLCFGNMGNVYLDRGEYSDAKRCFVKAIQFSRDQGNLAKWFSNTARAAIALKDWPTAEEYNNKALGIKRMLKDRRAELYSLRNAALIAQGKGEIGQAEALFTQVIRERSEDPSPALESEAGLAKLYAATHRPEKAEAQFQRALALLDETRSRLVKDAYKMSFLDSLMMFYRDYVDFLMSGGQQEHALEVAEASRARILCERLGVDPAAHRFTGAQYRQLANSTGAVFVSYWIAPERSFVWVTTGKDIASFPLPPQAKIASLVEAYRALVENLHDPLAVDDSSGSELYKILVAPIADHIAGSRRVTIIPDGPLTALNFETLPVGKHYLIDDAVISVAPALNLLAARSAGGPKRSRISGSLLLIGDPENLDERHPRLPYAGREMDVIARHFPQAHVTEFRSRRAVPAAYRSAAAQAFSYVHFTAHAIADREHPLDSAILLSGPLDAYRLTAEGVMQQPLHAGLVTLSACRTAGARTYAGEGLVGFTWAFFHAGARSVIAGLWDVSDESTPQLMDELYAGITGGKDPAEALRAAKLALMRSNATYSLPYYWGPFQLYVRDALP